MAKFYKSRVLTKNAEVSTLVLDIPEFSHKHCRVDRQNQLDPLRQNSSNSTDTETGQQLIPGLHANAGLAIACGLCLSQVRVLLNGWTDRAGFWHTEFRLVL